MNTTKNTPRLIKLSFVVAVGAMSFSTAASAQDPSTQGNSAAPATAEPQMRSPFWEGDSYARPRPYERRYRDPYYDDYYDEETFAESFPVDLVSLVAPARARYMQLHWTYLQTHRRIKLRVDEMRNDLERSQEYRELHRQRDAAIRALEDARRSATAALQDDPQYQALIDLENQLVDKIAQAHRSDDRDLEQLKAMAEVALNYARQRREMEAGLVRNDSTIGDAQQRVRDLGEQTRTMEDLFDMSIRNDPELLSLRQQLPLLKTEYLAAGGYYDSVVRSANVATRFAYFDALADAGYYTPFYPYYNSPFFGSGTFTGGGSVIIGGVTGDTGTGPFRMRPTIFPTPILSNTFRSLNQVPIPLIPTGQDAPDVTGGAAPAPAPGQ